MAPRCGELYAECPIDMSGYRSAQDRRGPQDPNLAVAVAISGGGHRAGNFGIGVLLGLEELARRDKLRTVLGEVDYLSTVSGGGLTAGAYLASLHDYTALRGSAEGYSLAFALSDDAARLPLERQLTDPGLRGHLEYNYVNEIIRGALTVATLGNWHRGDFLESCFDDNILGRKWRQRRTGADDASLTMSHVFVPAGSERRPHLPYWAANATTFENAAIFPFTPDHLALYQICGWRHRMVKTSCDRTPACETALAYRAPLALGLMASGTFPVALPAISLDSSMDANNPYLHLLDGGLADNLGVVTAVRMLRQDRAARKVLIVIDAYNGPLTPFSNTPRSPAMLPTAGRVAVGFLNAWRGRYREMTRALCAADANGPAIHPIFLSFDDLADCKDCSELERFGFTCDDLAALKRGGVTPGSRPAPFTLARDVWTWYDLSPAEQKLLFAIGRCVVHRKTREIRDAMGWE